VHSQDHFFLNTQFLIGLSQNGTFKQVFYRLDVIPGTWIGTCNWGKSPTGLISLSSSWLQMEGSFLYSCQLFDDNIDFSECSVN